MTLIRGPRPDDRNAERCWSEDRCADALEPRGAALIRELQRMPALSRNRVGNALLENVACGSEDKPINAACRC